MFPRLLSVVFLSLWTFIYHAQNLLVPDRDPWVARALLTAITSPMLSDSAAQKMSDAQRIPTHLCIWGAQEEADELEAGLQVSGPPEPPYLFSVSVSGGSWLQQNLCALVWTLRAQRLAFMRDPAATCCRQQPSTPHPCGHDGQVTNKGLNASPPSQIQFDKHQISSSAAPSSMEPRSSMKVRRTPGHWSGQLQLELYWVQTVWFCSYHDPEVWRGVSFTKPLFSPSWKFRFILFLRA